MNIEYDQRADAIYLHLSSKKQKVWKSREVERGIVLDLNKNKEIIGIELLEFSRRYKNPESLQFSVKHQKSFDRINVNG